MLTHKSRRVMSVIMGLGFAGFCAAVLSLAGIFLYLDPQVPKAETYRHVRLETPLRIYAQDGGLIAEFGDRRLVPLTIGEIPPLFIKAILDTEDKRFYSHSGIDYISLVNDLFELAISQEIRSGASTITMQLARNVSFSLEQTFIRKFKEMLLALKIEQELSKDEILELYINLVPFGKHAYGAEAAAQTYYGKSLKNLNLAQMAMLAGIPQAPTAGNPINGPTRALSRRNVVLSLMLAQNSINETQYARAIDAPITANVHKRNLDVDAPFPAEWVRQQLIHQFDDLYTGGYEVITTLDSNLQKKAINALRKGLTGYDRRHGLRPPEAQIEEDSVDPYPEYRQALQSVAPSAGLIPAVVVALNEASFDAVIKSGVVLRVGFENSAWARRFLNVNERGPRPKQPSDILQIGDLIRVQRDDETNQLAQLPEIQGSIVALDPDTGDIKALVGGLDFQRSQYNHVLQGARQPGSGFKPIVYSAALNAGITPATLFLDAPLVFDDKNLETQYRPSNDNNKYSGETRLRAALYRSINLVSIRVLQKVGAGNVLEFSKNFGFDTTSFPRNTQLAIGGGTMAVTPLDMATAYAVFANGGYLIEPHLIDRVISMEGKTLFIASHPEVCADCEDKLAAATLQDSVERENSELTIEEPIDLEALLVEAVAGDQSEPQVPAEEEEIVEPKLVPATRVLDERNAFIMHTMLQDVIKRGTGRKALKLKRNDLAGKTGTTNDAADTWFNGYTRNLVTNVWVGFDDHRPLGNREYGSTTPLPIWIDFMETALAGVAESTPMQPDGVTTMKIDPETGLAAQQRQRNAIFEYFLSEYVPEAHNASEAQINNPGVGEVIPEDIF